MRERSRNEQAFEQNQMDAGDRVSPQAGASADALVQTQFSKDLEVGDIAVLLEDVELEGKTFKSTIPEGTEVEIKEKQNGSGGLRFVVVTLGTATSDLIIQFSCKPDVLEDYDVKKPSLL